MTVAQPLLAVRGVKTYYGKIIALKGVDIDVNAGEIVTMIGVNGASRPGERQGLGSRTARRAGRR